MLNETNVNLGKVRSTIRELFEYGKIRKAEIGDNNVFDFSIGNPSVPAPEEVKKALVDLIENTDPVALHGYTSAQGYFSVRKSIAEELNSKFSTSLNADCIYMTCGASASLTVTLNALLNKGDEVIVFAPFFPEYKVFCEHAGGKLVTIGCDNSFQPDLAKFKKALSNKTKAVIINSPNNPSGVIYSEQTIKQIVKLVEECKNDIYIISDEPYRELVFNGVKIPFIMNYYKRSIVCYSYSKSLSLPGERIGYIAVNNQAEDFADLYAAILGAGRALGFVCAPALFQQLVKRCHGKTADLSIYRANRDRLLEKLTEYGFEFAKPDGAFYLFLKSPEGDARAFAERAKKYEILLVAGNDFGCGEYARLSYCVSPQMIERALPAFEKLAQSYNLSK
ncbi:MAG: pyridoxal phosphate-dependent aminotransferase [Clostridia bacterium]|nr:pyridoxal phosphate-dependent aminotransferase [Clostridia bacterium]